MKSLAILIAIFGLALAGCGTQTPTQPTIVTKIVDVPTPVRCTPTIGPDPAYPDTDAALASTSTSDVDYVKDLLAGRLLRIARAKTVMDALGNCEGVADPTTLGAASK